MTNTPMTFEEWLKNTLFTAELKTNEQWMELAWQASQAQQASVIAELVEALEYIEQWSHQLIKENKSRMVNDLIYVRAKQAIAKVKGK